MNTRNDSGDSFPVDQLDDNPEWDGSKNRDEILILEDDPEIGHFYEMKLTSPSRAIFIAQTMKEAARILEERDITLILLRRRMCLHDLPSGSRLVYLCGSWRRGIFGPSRRRQTQKQQQT